MWVVLRNRFWLTKSGKSTDGTVITLADQSPSLASRCCRGWRWSFSKLEEIGSRLLIQNDVKIPAIGYMHQGC